MTDDNPRLHRQLAGLASDWVSAKRRSLQRGQPNTVTDSGGSMGRYSWQGQELDRSELRKVKQMREKGGLVSWLFECKALMKFGTGAELQSENDDLQEWLNENFKRLDLLTLDLGSDGIWYPYGLGEVVETRGGEFSHIECIEPWTMLPRTNEYGEIVVWEQETQGKHNQTSTFQPDEIGSIVLNKSSGRDKVGVSEVLRSEEEITQYKENQRAVNKAIEIAGFPHHVWTVGAEGRSPVDDNDLRRVRNLIDNMDGDTQFVVGPDVNHDKITAADFDFGGVTKRDLRILTTTIGLPMELAGYGREGLGSGSETDLIGDMLALQNEVSRRRFETQFVEEFVRPVVREYSPYSEDEDINMVIKPFLDERENVADLIAKIGDYMTNEEIRDRLDLPPLEDEEIADAYRPPKQIEEAEEEDQQDDGMGGLFGSAPGDTDFRSLETRGHPISDPDECNGQVIEGPQGGLRCIPAGEEGGEESDTTVNGPEDIPDGGFSDEELKEVVNDVTPDPDDVLTGDVTSEAVASMESALPDDFDGSVFWEPADDPVPNRGQPVATDDGMAVMLDVETSDEGLEGLVVMTPDGEETIDQSDVTHTFDKDADPDVEDSEEPTEEPTDPDEIRESVSERPDVSEEVSGYVDRADSPQTVAGTFEDEIAVFGITEEEIIDEGVDVPRFATSGAVDEEQAQQFTQSVVEARERGWMDGLDGGVQLPSNNLNLPEGAQGTFKPGVRNFAGEKIRDTDNRKAEININPENNQEWDGEQKYVPFGPDEASKMEYAVSHEFGHSQHYNNLIEQRGVTVEEIESDEFQSELQDEMREHKDAISEEFSALAANNPFEFAADTFSALAVGADVSDEVLEAYEKIGGVTP